MLPKDKGSSFRQIKTVNVIFLQESAALSFRNLQLLSSGTCCFSLQDHAAFIFNILQHLSSVTCSIYLQQPAAFIFSKL